MGASQTPDMASPIVSKVGTDVSSGSVQGISVGTTYYIAVRAVKPSTVALYQQLLKNHILPRFETVPVADVQAVDVARMHAAMGKHPAVANQCVRLMHTLFRFAENRGYQKTRALIRLLRLAVRGAMASNGCSAGSVIE